MIDPSTLKRIGLFNASGLMVPDSEVGRAYFLVPDHSQNANMAVGATAFRLPIYDLYSHKLLDSILIPSVIGYSNRMVRRGSSGIAFSTKNGGESNISAPVLTYILSPPQF